MLPSKKYIIGLLLLLSLACSPRAILSPGAIVSSDEESEAEEVSPLATRTPLPTFTPTSAADVAIVIPPTPTMTPTSPPTPTPLPPTETPTPEPLPTDTPEPTSTPQPLPTQPPPPPAEEPPAEEPAPAEEAPPADPGVGAHGIRGSIEFRDGRNTYGVGEKVFVRMEAINEEEGLSPFGVLGLTTSNGAFQTSWSEGTIPVESPFRHEDGVAFSMPGEYKIWLSICFSPKDVCSTPDGDWERFEPGLDVIIQ